MRTSCHARRLPSRGPTTHARASKERRQVLGLGMIIGVRNAQQGTWDRSATSQEDHMVRKVEMLATKAGGIEGESAPEREGLKLAQDMPLKEQVIFTGSSDWTPEQAEHYIDWRVQNGGLENAQLRTPLDDPIAPRQRRLAGPGGPPQVVGVAHRQRPRAAGTPEARLATGSARLTR